MPSTRNLAPTVRTSIQLQILGPLSFTMEIGVTEALALQRAAVPHILRMRDSAPAAEVLFHLLMCLKCQTAHIVEPPRASTVWQASTQRQRATARAPFVGREPTRGLLDSH